MDCSTIVIVIILIAVAILLYFNFTDKDTSIFGGHKVAYGEKTLHIHKYKDLKDKLKNKLKESNSVWTKEKIRNRVKLIVSVFLESMNDELKSNEQAAAKYIDDLIDAYTNSEYMQTSIVDERTLINNLDIFINNQSTINSQKDITLK